MVSATDIITYIGVPLAVLGVMPILYTFLAVFIQDIVREGLSGKVTLKLKLLFGLG